MKSCVNNRLAKDMWLDISSRLGLYMRLGMNRDSVVKRPG
jgi:hypothetical protein